jgi:DNA-directed RNA polymerase subunit RPC12/RpoP
MVRQITLDPSVACGECGGRIPIAEFTWAGDTRMTRFADCARCGETTVIKLARPAP